MSGRARPSAGKLEFLAEGQVAHSPTGASPWSELQFEVSLDGIIDGGDEEEARSSCRFLSG